MANFGVETQVIDLQMANNNNENFVFIFVEKL